MASPRYPPPPRRVAAAPGRRRDDPPQALNDAGLPDVAAASHFSPRDLADLLGLVETGALSRRSAKELLPDLLAARAPVSAMVRERGLGQIVDPAALDAVVAGVLEAHPDEVALFRGGKAKLRKVLMGKAMGATRGRADPRLLGAALDRGLGASN